MQNTPSWRWIGFCWAAGWSFLYVDYCAKSYAQTNEKYGGTAIAERVPYQPEALHNHWTTETDQVELESVIADPEIIKVADVSVDMMPTGEDGITEQAEPSLPPGARNGIFQRLLVNYTLVPQPNSADLGWNDVETAVVLGFPFFEMDKPLLITPRFGVHFIEGAENFDLPNQVYDASVEFRHMRKIGTGPWGMDVAVTLGSFSDWEADNSDAFQVMGRGMGVYVSESGKKWLLGAAYVNIGETTVLPIVGMINDTNPDITYEFVFPRPRVSWKLPWGDAQSGVTRWAFLGGEFAGGRWSIEHPSSGEHDILAASDIRLLAGFERKSLGGLNWRTDVGFVFNRKLDFENAPNVDLDDTLLWRIGCSY